MSALAKTKKEITNMRDAENINTNKQTEWFQRTQPVEPFAEDVDRTESRRLHKRAIPQQCWFNVRRAILRLAEYNEASYIEGWVMDHVGLAFEHGWIVKDGKIIDPTLPTQVAVYFPGLEIKGRKGIEEFLATPQGKKCKRSPFFFAFGWGGMDHPGMRRAWELTKERMDIRDGKEPQQAAG
jgi:hypothetical protein